MDDEQLIIEALKRSLSGESYEIVSANSGETGLRILEEKEFNVVISDEVMPGMSGVTFLSVVAREYPDTAGILLTGHPSVEVATEAVNQGQVSGFIVKPWNDIELGITIRQAIENKKSMTEGFEQVNTDLNPPVHNIPETKPGKEDTLTFPVAKEK